MNVHIDVPASVESTRDGSHEQIYDGVRVWKLREDLDRYRHIIEATRPELIVETGTRWGGSALWFAREFRVDVVTVDLEAADTPALSGWPITQITGNSVARDTVARVASLAAGRRTMVVLDADHHAPVVAMEISAYGPLVTPGCYLVVEDGIFDLADIPKWQRRGGGQIPELGGPLRAIREVLAGDPAWVRDEDIERMHPISHHPAGWWRRA